MSFRDCVEAAVQAGTMTREQAEELYAKQGDAESRFRLDPQHSAESAARMAEEFSLERAKQDVRLRKYQTALQAIRNTDNANAILRYEGGATEGIRTLLTRDPKGRSTWNNVEFQSHAILGQVHAQMADSLSKLRSRWFGFQRDKKLLLGSIRELFGEESGDASAKTFAKVWGKAAEDLRQRFNRAGGAIPRRADWGLPQTHDPVLVGRVSAGEWVDFVMPRLAIDRMMDLETGTAFTPEALDITLQNIHQTISTNGVSDMVPGMQGGAKLANRRQEARFLVFKDADSWLEYQERFGSSNLFATMMDHLRDMSREIALLEVMGPNPSANFKYLQDVARKTEDKPVARAFNQSVFNLVNGSGDLNKSPNLAAFFGGVRSWNVSSMLGGAALSALSDSATLGLTAKWNGMSIMKTFGNYLAQMRPGNEADRILATRIGITALSWADGYSNVGRFSELGGGGGGALGKFAHAGNVMAELTLRASGLNAMTDAGKRAFALEWGANIAESLGKDLDKIEGPFGDVMRRTVSPDDWQRLKATPLAEHNGAKFFVVDHLMNRTDLPTSTLQDLAGKLQQGLLQEMQYAIPEPDAAARVFTTGGGAQRGTMVGEVGRTLLQFKSFPIAMLSLHAQRALAARRLRGPMTAVAYAANAIIFTTAFGFAAMQLKQLAKGKDLRDPEDPGTWAAAFVQGGGAGIYGDFLFNDVNRFGKGAVETMLGPSVGLADDVTKLTLGNVQAAIKGDDPKLASDMIGFSQRYTPGGSLWYTRLLLEREIFDQLSLAADPRGAQRRFNRQEQRARDEASGYWWSPGETAPDRAPEVGQAR